MFFDQTEGEADPHEDLSGARAKSIQGRSRVPGVEIPLAEPSGQSLLEIS